MQASNVCDEVSGPPGWSGGGLGITSATLARVLDEVHNGLEDKRDVGVKHWLLRVLTKGLLSPAEERLPTGV